MGRIVNPLDLAEEPQSPAPAAAPPPSDEPRSRLWRWLRETKPSFQVGTLAYTRLGLFLMFVWLLWGDLVWTIMENVFPNSMPLQLDRLGVPKEWIGYIMGTAAAVINMTFVPVISFRSDRTRTRWGRRLPYLIVTTPFVCIFLASLGFTDDIGAWIRSSPLAARLHLSPMTLIVFIVGMLILLFNVFNVFVNSIYWYLFRDVVPSQYLGRFMAAFRMVAALGLMFWNGVLYGRIEQYTRSIYVGTSLIYLFGFGLMCLMVKEGKYPPPEDYVKQEPFFPKLWHAIQTYARECFVSPLFVCFYFSQALIWAGQACNIYKQLFYIRHLGFTTAEMGHFNAILGPIILLVQFPMGWLVDKVHPMRAYVVAMTASLPMLFAGYFLRDYAILGYTFSALSLWITITTVQMPILQLREASEVPLMMRLFPRKQYGQFSSANAMLRHFAAVFGTVAGATFIGWTNRKYGQFGNAHAFLWHGYFQTAGVVLLWIVYAMWRRAGADNFKYEVPEAAIAADQMFPISDRERTSRP